MSHTPAWWLRSVACPPEGSDFVMLIGDVEVESDPIIAKPAFHRSAGYAISAMGSIAGRRPRPFVAAWRTAARRNACLHATAKRPNCQTPNWTAISFTL
jgi:hypothetical protein